MKIKKILNFFLPAALLCSVAGCSQKAGVAEAVELAYSTGFDEYGNYDNDLFFYNGADMSLADPGVIYVPKERDSEYGGYYYAYGTAGQTLVPNNYDYAAALNATKTYDETYNIGEGNDYETISAYHDDTETVTSVEVLCYRSKDLSVWEECGALPRGYCAMFTNKDWDTCNYSTSDPYKIGNCVCAPELIYNETNGLYYMYYSREAKSEAVGMFNRSDRNRIGLAVSPSPVGPFTSVYIDDPDSDYNQPMFSVQAYFEDQGLEGYGTIDVTVFIDDDGEKYMYFNHVQGGKGGKEIGILGVKMTCWTHVDFETIKLVLYRSKKTVQSGVGADCIINNNVTPGEEAYNSEGAVNEGPQMLKHNGKYYISYSANGFSSKSYSVHQAVSDSPLGDFTKIGAVLDASSSDYTGGTGHHYFIEKDGELFVVYHKHGYAGGWNGYRLLAADRCVWTTDENGNELLAANGPSLSLQWQSKTEDGLQNIASLANVKVSDGSGEQYLTDGMVPFYSYNEDKVFSANEKVKVEMSFDAPVAVRSLMIFNGYSQDVMFNVVKNVQFDFAEKPAWLVGDYKYAFIKEITIEPKYIDTNIESIISCCSLVASFNEINVSKITFEVERNSAYPGYFSDSNKFNVSEIVVMGRVAR